MIERLLKLQAKIIPDFGWLIIIHWVTICVALFINFKAYGLIIGVVYCVVSYKLDFPKKDKLEHYYMGVLYCLFGMFLDFDFNTKYIFLIVPGFFALAKELRDLTGKGNVEFLDFLYTILFSLLFIKI
jgi:hypothetical protein